MPRRAEQERLTLVAAHGLDARRQRTQLAALLVLLRTDGADDGARAGRGPRHPSGGFARGARARGAESRREIADLGAARDFRGLRWRSRCRGARSRWSRASARKCEFLERGAAAGVANARRVRAGRGVAGGGGARTRRRPRARAAGGPLEYAAPLLGSAGRWSRGRRVAQRRAGGARAAGVLGLSRVDPRRAMPYGARRDHLHVFASRRRRPRVSRGGPGSHASGRSARPPEPERWR